MLQTWTWAWKRAPAGMPVDPEVEQFVAGTHSTGSSGKDAPLSSGSVDIRLDAGGSGGPVLVMLHGIGGNAAVWNRMQLVVERNWPGRWVAADLRGHGRSAHAPPYGYAVFAADVAGAIGNPDDELVLLGHSMGGVVAMALATGWFGVSVRHVFAFGVKISWTADEVTQMKGLAAAPARVFDSRAEAAARYLRVSGLAGLVGPGAPEALAGIVEAEGGLRLAADQGVYAAVGPAVGDFYRAAAASVRLAAGRSRPDGVARRDADARSAGRAIARPRLQLPCRGAGAGPGAVRKDPGGLERDDFIRKRIRRFGCSWHIRGVGSGRGWRRSVARWFRRFVRRRLATDV